MDSKNIQSLPEPRPTFPQEKGEDIPHTITISKENPGLVLVIQ